MKKIVLVLLTSIFYFGCSTDKACFQEWTVSEYCTRKSSCNVVACETPTNNTKRFKCSDVEGVKEGDVVLYQTVDCAKFYRRFIKRIE